MGQERPSTGVRRARAWSGALAALLLVTVFAGTAPARAQGTGERLEFQLLEPGQRQDHYRALIQFAGAYPARTGTQWVGFFDHVAEATELTLAGANDDRMVDPPDHPSWQNFDWHPYQRRYRNTDFLGFIPIDSMTVGGVQSVPIFQYLATTADQVTLPPRMLANHDLVIGTRASIERIEAAVAEHCDTAPMEGIALRDEYCAGLSNYIQVRELGHVFPEYVPGTVPLYWNIEFATQAWAGPIDLGRPVNQAPLTDARVGRGLDEVMHLRDGASATNVGGGTIVSQPQLAFVPVDRRVPTLVGYVFPALPEVVEVEQVCGSTTTPCETAGPQAPTLRYDATFTNDSSETQDSAFAVEYQVGERTSVSQSRTDSTTNDLTTGVTVGVEAGFSGFGFESKISIQSSTQQSESTTVSLGRDRTLDTSRQTTETFSVPVRIAPRRLVTASVEVFYDLVARDTYVARLRPVLRHWEDQRPLDLGILQGEALLADADPPTAADLTISVELDVLASRSSRVETRITETPLEGDEPTAPDPDPDPAEPDPAQPDPADEPDPVPAGPDADPDPTPTGDGPDSIPPQPEFQAGYRVVESSGVVHGFGDADRLGDALVAPGVRAVDIDDTADGDGYWVADSDGTVYAFGTATHFGHLPRLAAGEEVTAISSTPDDAGYWLFTSLGNAHAYGDARLFPVGGIAGNPVDLGTIPLNGPVLDAIPTPSGLGYYMVAADGGVFAFGDAAFHGSMGSIPLNEPVRSLVPDPDGSGYWLVASDGGVFAFEAEFVGSLPGTLQPGQELNAPVTGMVPWGNGYLMVATDGGVFSFSDDPFLGSLGASPPPTPITSVTSFIRTG